MNDNITQTQVTCHVCFRHCVLSNGKVGFCHARQNINGENKSINYGIITSLALDPIEKKPLRRFFPGSMILSVGSFGCNLSCPFCQNYEISTASIEDVYQLLNLPASAGSSLSSASSIMLSALSASKYYYSPEKLSLLSESLKAHGNIGLAFTYNEPMIGYEFVRDSARLNKEKGLKNVLVTNGTIETEVLDEVLPYIDAMNIDLKSFNSDVYRKELGGDLENVKRFIRKSALTCHVELTTLVVPGMNDSETEIREICAFINEVEKESGSDIVLHLTRYFPRYRLNRPATNVETVYHLADVARESLKYVFTGNC